ncbi:MAG: hypothetical protein NTZ48_03245 [Candidatus Omnitrophica bacterium]|nr:hypothetical protein [Candidatus Omnitrophota bacterium]
MFRLAGVFAVIPTAMILTVSFFVLFALRKLEAGALKVFGFVIVALLWISAGIIFSSGMYTLATGNLPKMCPMKQMMMQKMMKDKMPGPMMDSTMPKEKSPCGMKSGSM